ncbi:hypothetical protein AHAS_Ahas14G0122200 [Arachis hypogaea]
MALSSDTILNLKEECKVISLRIGKVLGKEVKEDVTDNQEKEAQEEVNPQEENVTTTPQVPPI